MFQSLTRVLNWLQNVFLLLSIFLKSSCLLHLFALIHKLTSVHSFAYFFRTRLGADSNLPWPEFTSSETCHASAMLYEIESTVNTHIAQCLLRSFGDVTPLLRQRQPPKHSLDRWKEEFAQNVWNSVGLRRYFKSAGA